MENNELTEEHIDELRDVFNMFDKTGDGRITIDELGIVMRALGLFPTEIELVRMINKAELAESSSVSFDEFVEMLKRKMEEAHKESEVKEAFRGFDRDRDGYISAADLKYVMRSLGQKLTNEEVNEMIQEADADGDGMISLEDFLSVIKPK